MDKRILEEYIDACEVIKDAEEEIRKLESKKRITAMRRYPEVIRNFLTTHSILRYREQPTLIQTISDSGQRKKF
ncbi:MAG: hypothetical protein ACLTX6_11485 [Lachnospiraceae bacterium]